MSDYESLPDVTGSRTAGPYDARRDPLVLTLVVIVVGALVLLVVGFGGGGAAPANNTTDGDGTVDGTATPQPDRVQLLVEANRTRAVPDQPVRIRVVTVNGDPVAGANVTVAGRTTRTGQDGTVTVAIGNAGTYDVAAYKRTPATTYLGNTTTVQVARRTVGLSLSLNRSRVTVGDPVEAVVTTEDGTPVQATVSVGDRTLRTDETGRVVFTARSAETDAVTADRSATRTTRYEGARESLTVERRVVDLAVTTNRTRVTVDDPVGVLLTRAATGEPIAGEVTVGNRTLATDDDGRLTVRPREAGTLSIVGRVARTAAVRYRAATATVGVERERVSLALEVRPSDPGVNETVTVLLYHRGTGDPVAGTVDVGTATYRTDGAGTVTFPAPRPGNYTVRGTRNATRTTRYEPASRTLSVRGPWVAVERVDGPSNVTAGDDVTVNVTVANVGTEAGNRTVAFRLGNRTLANESVALAPGDERTLTFSVTVPTDRSGPVTVAVVADESIRYTMNVTPAGS